jgi:DNA invertase Pin-like site-specific DNA recombinase
MNNEARHQKVTASHLQRDAYLYIRQSTMRQVLENTESTKRQYDLRQQAVAMGWPLERVKVIDCDQAQSGAFKNDRDGFQEMVAAVSLGHAGIVMGLEVSRLARNNADWHSLLELCAFSGTLILDQDGLYDAMQFNDRLLLGLKGAMSEAELHVLKSRLQGGILSKARRGELKIALPAGLDYDARDRVVLAPDKQVQEVFYLFFESFRRIGSAFGVVRNFRRQNLQFPRRPRCGPRKGELVWGDLTHSQARRILHQPRYAGAFCYGRTRTRKDPKGRMHYEENLPREQWIALIKDVHPGYLTWDEYENNLQRLRENCQAYGRDRRKSPPREGPALLQGLVICRRCGKRMTVRYHIRKKRLSPDYACQGEGIENGHSPCQRIPGACVDETISKLLVEMVNPLTLNVAVQVQKELQCRLEEADQLRQRQVERARYEADMTQRRYMQVDPANRLVADVLEAEWNDKLRRLSDTQDEYEHQRKKDRKVLDEETQKKIFALVTEFPKVWSDPATSDRDRKRMVQLLIEDVTLLKDETTITLNLRFKGGADKTITLPRPLGAPVERKTDPRVIEEIDRLLEDHTEAQIADILNESGRRSGTGELFTRLIVKSLRNTYNIKGRYQRLQERGLLTSDEIAGLIGIKKYSVNHWRLTGLLQAILANDKNDYLYERPSEEIIEKIRARTRYKCMERQVCLSANE